MKSISVQYQELKEGKMNKHQFLRNARMMFPNFVTNLNSFDDSVKILKNKGLLNEGNAVKGTPDKAPSYDYPTQPAKYMKVVQEPEVDEQDGIYPATTVTDIPKEEVSKPIKSKNRPDGLEPIKPNDTKNEMKKIRIVKESKKNLTENSIKSAAKKGMSTGDYSELDALVLGKPLKETEEDKKKDESPSLAPGTSVKMSPQVQDKIQGFLKSFASAGASAPGESANKLRDKIKEILQGILDEDKYGQEIAGNPEEEADAKAALIRKEYEEGDESDDAPSGAEAANIIADKMIDAIESELSDEEDGDDKSYEKSDLEDMFGDFENSMGKRYSDDVFQDVIAKLRKKGYNLK